MESESLAFDVHSPLWMSNRFKVVPIFDRLPAGMEVKYTSGRGTILGNPTGDSVVANVTLGNTWLKDRVELPMSVYDLFDQHYSHPDSAEHVQELIEQNGRNVRLGLRCRF